MKKRIVLSIAGTLALVVFAAMAPAQDQPQAREGAPAGERLMGTITAVGVNQFTIKKRDGTSQTVVVNDQTKISEGRRAERKTIQLEDLKNGDGVFVIGQPDAHEQFVAAQVHRVPAEMMERFQANRGNRAFGQIESIDGNQLKLHNRRGEQTVTVNDQTTFLKDGQAITLKDLKVGDRIFAVGDESNGQFTATRVVTGQFRGRGYRRDRGPATGPPNSH